MFIKKYGDIFVGIFFAVLGLALIISARMLPKSAVMEIGPDFMPTVVGTLILVLAVILLVQSYRELKKNPDKVYEKDESDYKRVLMSLILALLYVFLLKPVGFIVCTLVYLFGQIMVLAPDTRRTKKDMITYLIINVVFTLVVYYLFRMGFKIILPAGILKF
ncbi:MAG: tripartite tricarboxylate transporter TctB family protein [Lachnospiraceae bacterium]|nr:tripartite tricarboxylate transporter TctB family protein [Lachnospiraceae bacterium]